MDTLFIQFYSKVESYKRYELCNGFSDTYDLCKSKGDFHWVNYDNSEKNIPTHLPIKKGKVYVSTLFSWHLFIVYVWAIIYPEIKFIVGGSALGSSSIRSQLPKNIKLTYLSVEEYFGVPNFSGEWKLDLPKDITNEDIIYFTYVLDNGCHWGKCNFCSYKEMRKKTKMRTRKHNIFEFQNVDHTGAKIIRLGTDAIIPAIIKELKNLPVIKDLYGYLVFLRAGKQELEVIESFDDLDWTKDIRFNIGLEYPTNDMWKYMKKGYDVDTVIKILNLLKNGIHITMLLGWDNLEGKDLGDLKEFMDKIPHAEKNCVININKLFAIPGTDIHKTYKRGNEYRLGPFYMGFSPCLTKEQIKINSEAKEIIISAAKEKNYLVVDGCEFEDI